jgi:integrase
MILGSCRLISLYPGINVMAKKLSKPNERGLYATEKGGHKFYLGTERQEAERRKGAIEALFDSVNSTWDEFGLMVAKAIAKGDKTLTLKPWGELVGAPADHLTAILRFHQAKYPWVNLQWEGIPIVAEKDFSPVAKTIASVAAEVSVERRGLHLAMDAYAKHAKDKHVNMDDGLPTEFVMAEERFIEFIKRVFPDMPLAKFDMGAIDALRLTIAKRPLSYKKKPIAPETVRRLVKVVNRFIKWLHKSTDFTWRKPDDYEIERVSVQMTNAEIQERFNPHNNPIYTDEQIGILFKYATPCERLLILLALNCGFKQAEALGLQIGEYDLANKMMARVRYKTKVYGQWRLWDATCEALKWAEGQRPDKTLATLIQNKKGEALGKRTVSGNRGARVANKWASLEKRIKKDYPNFVMHPYSTLRDTGASAIRAIAGGEVAEIYLSHGNPIPDGVLLERYANKPWHKLHDALTEWGNKIEAAFKVDDAFPDDYKPTNISVSKGTIEKIKDLRNQGYKLGKIAEIVGCPYHIARVYAKQ